MANRFAPIVAALLAMAFFSCEQKKSPEAPKENGKTNNNNNIGNNNNVGGGGGGYFPQGNGGQQGFEQGWGAGSSCTQTSCPKGNVTISVNGTTTLTGQAGQPLLTRFDVVPQDYPNHQVSLYRIEATPQSGSMIIRNNDSESVSFEWTPQSNDAPTGTLLLMARDMTACDTAHTNASECTQFTRRLSQFDTSAQVNWQISGANGSGFQSQTMLAVGIGALQGMLSGNGVQGVLSGVLNGLGTVGGGINSLNNGTSNINGINNQSSFNSQTGLGTQNNINTGVPMNNQNQQLNLIRQGTPGVTDED